MKNKKNTARLLSFVMVLAVLLTAGIVLGINASATEEEALPEYLVATDKELKTALNTIETNVAAGEQAGGIITLTADIPLSKDYNKSASYWHAFSAISQSVTIRSGEGGPYTISYAQDLIDEGFTGALFLMNTGDVGTITLLDVIFDGTGVTTGKNGGLAYFNAATTAGGTVLNFGSEAEPDRMPEIRNFTAVYGALSTNTNSVVNVYGAKFHGNTASYGAAYNTMRVYKGALNVYGTLYVPASKSIGNSGGSMKLDKNCRILGLVEDGDALTSLLSNTSFGWTTFGAAGASGASFATYGVSLQKDVAVSDGISVACTLLDKTNAFKVELEGNGHTISSTAEDPVFTVAAGIKFTVSDVAIDAPKAIYVAGGEVAEGEEAPAAVGNLVIDGAFAVGENAISVENEYANITLAKTARLYADPIKDAAGLIAMLGAEEATTVSTPDWSYFSTATADDKGATFVGTGLFADITLDTDATISVVGNKSLNGCGYTIYRSANASGVSMFTVADGANVTFTDVVFDGSLVEGDTTTLGGAFNVATGATLTLNGDTVVKNFVAKNGLGVYCTGGLVVMEDNASIEDNNPLSSVATYGSGAYLDGATLVMTGGKISNNGGGSTSSRGGAIYMVNGSTAWILGGEISGNVARQYGGAIRANDNKSIVYLLGGAIKDNTVPRSAGDGAALSGSGNIYLMGGAVTGNTITDADATKRTFQTVQARLGASVKPASIPDAVTAFAATDAGKKILTISDDGEDIVVTSKVPLVVENNVREALDAALTNVTLVGDLVAGSRVVFADNGADGYFLNLAADYAPDPVTLNAIQLLGADALYSAELTEDGSKLAWPGEDTPYQIVRAAALKDKVDFRLSLAYRDANATRATISASMTDIEEKTYTSGDAGYVEIPMAPKYMMREVTVYLDGVAQEDTYTLAQYLKDVKEKCPNNAELVALIDALLNYGSAAQVYLGCDASTLANADYETAIGKIEFAENANNYNIDGDNASAFYSADVEIGSQVSVSVIMTAAAYNAGFTVKLGDDVVVIGDPREVGGDHLAITIADISAANLAKPITVTLTDGTVLTYSIPAYAVRMFEKDTNETVGINDNFKVLVKALYAYAAAADAYAN